MIEGQSGDTSQVNTYQEDIFEKSFVLVIKGVSTTSRRLSSFEIFFCISGHVSAAIGDKKKISIYNLAIMSNEKLKKLAQHCISLDDVYDKCENSGQPTLLYQEGDCTRTVEETPEVVAKN